MRDEIRGHHQGNFCHLARLHLCILALFTFQVKIVERVGVAPEETVRIFLEFKRVESAIKGEFSSQLKQTY